MSSERVVLWAYIAILVLGGLMGFLKARSRISLVTSVVFGALLALCAVEVLPWRAVFVIQAILLLVFGWLLLRGKKFMPSGMMLILTVVAMLLEYHPLR